MSTTPEKKVKNKIVKILKEYKVYHFYAFSGGYGKSGVPDIICCHRGQFLAIEVKAGQNKPTVLQQLNIDQINSNGGTAVVINEDNINELAPLLETL
jgi:Holliday junction resolvase